MGEGLRTYISEIPVYETPTQKMRMLVIFKDVYSI